MMTNFAHVGDFCPNEACPDYGKIQSDQQRNIKEAGKTKSGRQRYQCKKRSSWLNINWIRGSWTLPGLTWETRVKKRLPQNQ